MRDPSGPEWMRRLLAAGGALCCAIAIGWAAYAAHAVEPALRARADSAMLMLVVHGLALAVFAPRQRSLIELFALLGWAAGIAAFCGSLMLSVLIGSSTALAPAGGVLLMGAWLLHAVAIVRR